MALLLIKKLRLIFLIVISIILLISCGGSSIKKGSVVEYKLQLITQNAETEPAYRGALAFAKKLDELSSGMMTVEFTKIENVTSVQTLIEPVRSGEFDIVIIGYGTLSYAIPELELISQAYVVTDYQNFIKTLDYEYGEKMDREIKKLGLVPSEIWFLGTRHVTSNYPINSLANFRGLRLRTPPTEANIAFAESMGAIAIPTSLSEIYNVLKTQYIQAQENPLSTIEAHKIYELQKCIAMTGHSITASSLFINKDTYDSFSAEQEAWYNEAVEYGRRICSNIVVREEEFLLEKFEKEYGMTITYPDRNELRKAMHPHYDKIEEKFGKDSIYSLVAIE